jgi:hypothetical protein
MDGLADDGMNQVTGNQAAASAESK